MRIAVIGGGFTGLTAAYTLTKHGHKVTVFEKEPRVGGLAVGFQPKQKHGEKTPVWKWPLEVSYHHFFTNDHALIALAKELGMANDLMILRPVTATLCHQDRDKSTLPQHQLDSPLHLLTFPHLSLLAKFRTAALLGFCKVNPFWQPLENVTAENLFITVGGKEAWSTLWEPLMTGKFSTFAKKIPASWLWARIHKRTPRLGYFRGGFQAFAEKLAQAVRNQGGKIELATPIPTITYIEGKKKFSIDNTVFDRVLLTTPSHVSARLIKFPKTFEKQLTHIPHLWAQLLIIETDKPILEKTYWLNINDRSYPFLALVQHTNMINKKYYAGRHIAYVGNYLPDGHPYLSMNKKELLKIFLPYLKKINPAINYQRLTTSCHLFTVPFAQPVHTLHYSHKAPGITTPIPHCYIANLDSIYPWDRGTNYAVELGQKAAENIMRDA